jgi:hypothetical protein
VQHLVKEDLLRGFPTEGFAGAAVEEQSNSIHIGLSDVGKGSTFGKVLAQQSVSFNVDWFDWLIGRQTDWRFLARSKLYEPSLMTIRSIFSTLKVPCIARFASLPLTKGTSQMVTTANTKRTGIVRNKAINTESASRGKNGWR